MVHYGAITLLHPSNAERHSTPDDVLELMCNSCMCGFVHHAEVRYESDVCEEDFTRLLECMNFDDCPWCGVVWCGVVCGVCV